MAKVSTWLIHVFFGWTQARAPVRTAKRKHQGAVEIDPITTCMMTTLTGVKELAHEVKTLTIRNSHLTDQLAMVNAQLAKATSKLTVWEDPVTDDISPGDACRRLEHWRKLAVAMPFLFEKAQQLHGSECAACGDSVPAVVLLPSRHICMCDSCAYLLCESVNRP